MKKIYITPNALVIKIETQHMIAESMNVNEETKKGFGESLSRENKSWDED